MFFIRLFTIILFLLCLTEISQPQTNVDTSVLQIRLDALIKDASKLKLPENQAIVYSRLGRIYWRIDKNRAKQLFRDSIDQLILAQKEAELEPNSQFRNDLVIYGETRRKILDTIVGHDEELGFELFEKSRSATVKNALKGIATEPAYNTYNNVTSVQYIPQQENTLEQNLIARTISYNPQRAINYLRQKPSPKLTYVIFQILQALQEKDKAVTNELKAEIIKQLLSTNFTIGSSELGFANLILDEASQSNKLNIDAQTLRQIAEKIADFLIKEANNTATQTYTYLIPRLIKYLPEREKELTEKTILPRRSNFEIFPINKEAQDLLNSKAIPEELLSEADKFPAGFREQIYIKATNQIALDGEFERAKEILTKNFPKERLPQMFANLNWQILTRAMQIGEFDKSLALIEQMPESSKFQALITLANAMRTKTPDDKPKIIAILEKARQLLPAIPNTNQEFYQIGGLASEYALIEPDIGFSLLDKLVKKHIEVSEAAAIVDSFQGSSHIRKNEFLIGSHWRGLADFNTSLNNFIKVDFERAMKIVGQIPRLDQRVALELLVFEKAFNL